ncbi:MAG: hypothetical protein ACLRVT_08850, partial [Oscillospiraceae bacterium]
MQKSLFAKYYTICSAIILICFTFLGIVFLTFAAQYFKLDKQKLLLRNTQQAVAITVNNYEMNSYRHINSTVVDLYKIFGDSIDATIFLTDLQGKTLACTEDEACVHRTYTVPQDIMDETISGSYR